MSKIAHYNRLRRAFEHHCVVTGLFSPYKASVLIWLEASNAVRPCSSEERSMIVDYIWDHLWQLN